MKNINNYIFEKLKLNKQSKILDKHIYVPKSEQELVDIISEKIKNNIDTFNYKEIDLDLTDIDVSLMNDLSFILADHNAIKSINVTDWNVSKVHDFSDCFSGCKNLEKIIGLDTWDMSNATSIASMFEDCEKLEDIGDLSSWKLSNVVKMRALFKNCNHLKEIKGIDKWDIKNAEKIDSMFKNCYNLQHIDLSNWHPKNVNNFKHLFYGCNSLKSIGDINDWINYPNIQHIINNMETVDIMQIFNNCPAKEPDWISNITRISNITNK